MWNPNIRYWRSRAAKLEQERDEARTLAQRRARRLHAIAARVGLLSDYVAKLPIEPYALSDQDYIVTQLRDIADSFKGLNTD